MRFNDIQAYFVNTFYFELCRYNLHISTYIIQYFLLLMLFILNSFTDSFESIVMYCFCLFVCYVILLRSCCTLLKQIKPLLLQLLCCLIIYLVSPLLDVSIIHTISIIILVFWLWCAASLRLLLSNKDLCCSNLENKVTSFTCFNILILRSISVS